MSDYCKICTDRASYRFAYMGAPGQPHLRALDNASKFVCELTDAELRELTPAEQGEPQ